MRALVLISFVCVCVNHIKFIQCVEPIESIESIESIKPIESIEPIEPVKSVESIESIESVGLLHDVYTAIFRLRDGSTLSSVDSASLDSMRGSVRRVLAVGGGVGLLGMLNHTRGLPDDRLLGLLLLAVAGNFTVDQSPSALPQKCGIVVDPGTGALMLRDNAVAQSDRKSVV